MSKVTRTGTGSSLLERADVACRIVEAVAAAVRAPVTVKMRRGLEDGSRACLDLGPRLVEAGRRHRPPPPLRPADVHRAGRPRPHRRARAAGVRAGHRLGDITCRAEAERVLAETGAAAVMVARPAQGNPWALREIAGGDGGRLAEEVEAGRPCDGGVALPLPVSAYGGG